MLRRISIDKERAGLPGPRPGSRAQADPARLISVAPAGGGAVPEKKGTPPLLWRHHAGRGRHAAAAALMEDLAAASGAKLDDRVGCLVRAADAARRACSAPQLVDDQAPLCDAARVPRFR